MARLAEAERFYTEALGFDLVQRYAGTAAFFSAGGYHHHIGVNTWAGEGAPPPPAGAVGLEHVEIALPTADALARVARRLEDHDLPISGDATRVSVRDPSGNRLKFSVYANG